MSRSLGLPPPPWVIALCIGVASVGLLTTGYGLAAALLLAGGGVVAVARRGEPRRIARVERFVEVTEVSHSCDVVWALLGGAESAPMLHPMVRRAYHVNGTPVGLGERQAFELTDGTTTIVEVVEYEPGRRVVTVQVSPAPESAARHTFSVDPIDGGCALSRGWEVDVPAGQRVRRRAVNAWRREVRDGFDRVRRSLAEIDPSTSSEVS